MYPLPKDEIEISISDGESVELPFRYLAEDGKPVLPDGLVEYLKKKRSF
jgi:ribosome biogenesis SPOUT family RNA methylase Rps3